MEKYPEAGVQGTGARNRKKTKQNINRQEGEGDEDHFGDAISIIQVTDGSNGGDGGMWKVVTCLLEAVVFNIHA